MRAARLLSIQMMLETRGQLSARELADALEVSSRSAGVPAGSGCSTAGTLA
jgi:predicted DNA-binding transcriptional regulator YafY